MQYVSTRQTGGAGASFEAVLLAGLARDGGLFVPERWPTIPADRFRAMAGLGYADLAAELLAPFLGDAIARKDLESLCHDTYAVFRHPAVAPLVQLGSNLWLLELFHGPTLAFKDFALQLLGRLFDHVLARRGERLTIVGATSGDTGSAAIEACSGRESLTIIMLHPKGRISEVQRRQMTTVDADNVHNIAIEGTFDDCQALVKAMFNDLAFRDALNLAAVNSINWARVMAQMVYYVYAALALGTPARAISFSVPTGNFGNVYAGYGASRLGLPIERLLVATNANDILARFFEGGEYRKGEVQPTISPSMDIQVASNFERLLFDLHGRDAAVVSGLMRRLDTEGGFKVDPQPLRVARQRFDGQRVDDDRALAAIERVWRECGVLIDPHTAAGVAAAEERREDGTAPMVCLATAHPAKFPEAVERATGKPPTPPSRLADVMKRRERCTALPNDIAVVKEFVRSHATAAATGQVA